MKKMLDEAHRDLIAKGLSTLPPMDWASLIDENDEIDKKQEKAFFKQVADWIKSNDANSDKKKKTVLSPAKFISGKIKECKQKNHEIPECLEKFNRFGGYFDGYSDNRQNLYGCKGNHGEVAYRTVHENFALYRQMVNNFNKLKELDAESGTPYCGIVSRIENELSEKLDAEHLSDIFGINQYGRFLTQEGIDFLNGIVGGYTKEDRTKVRGINEFINLARQADGGAKRISPFKQLRKQLLVPGESWSFVGAPFNSDEEMVDSIIEFLSTPLENGNVCERIVSLVSCVNFDDDGIFVNANALDKISHKVFGQHDAVKNLLECRAEDTFKKKSDRDKFLAKEYFPLNELSKLSDEDGRSIKNYWNVGEMKTV